MNAEEISKEVKRLAVRITGESKSPHIGSALSVADILTSIYFDVFSEDLKPENSKKAGSPRIILSKGHAVAALYATLHLKGYISMEKLLTYHKNGGIPGHADMSVEGVGFSTGSLGHGLAVGVGIALAQKLDGKSAPAIVVMGDGECQEGEVWEAANFAAAKSVGNLLVIVDCNGLQAYGRTGELGGSLEKKWAAFGWNVIKADGHNLDSLGKGIRKGLVPDAPSVILAKTVKGKGIPHIEGKIESHYRPPKGDELG